MYGSHLLVVSQYVTWHQWGSQTHMVSLSPLRIIYFSTVAHMASLSALWIIYFGIGAHMATPSAPSNIKFLSWTLTSLGIPVCSENHHWGTYGNPIFSKQHQISPLNSCHWGTWHSCLLRGTSYPSLELSSLEHICLLCHGHLVHKYPYQTYKCNEQQNIHTISSIQQKIIKEKNTNGVELSYNPTWISPWLASVRSTSYLDCTYTSCQLWLYHL